MAPGRHLAMNAVATMAVTQGLGCDLTVAACDIAKWSPPAGRGMKEILAMDLVEDHLTFTLIDDAFNANPASLQAGAFCRPISGPTHTRMWGNMWL